jgi:hypothetical protein
MHIKNVVILLQKILPFFPREKGQGGQVEGLIKNAIAQEKREDLKLLLQSCVRPWTRLETSAFSADPVRPTPAGTPLSSVSSSRSGCRRRS